MLKTRQYYRVPTNLESNIKAENQEEDGHFVIKNLSFGGVFVESQEPYDPETLLEISFSLPGANTLIEAVGFVIWINKQKSPNGMGIQFLSISQKNQDTLRDFIKQATWNF